MEITVKVMRLSVAALFVSVAYSQSASQSDKPTFEIASVQVSPRATWAKTAPNAMQGGFLIGDRYEIHRATMLDLIHLAWQVDADKIYGGPGWLDYDKFDIVAKTAPGTRAETLRGMLQSVLAERFQLAVMPDTKPLPAYVLSAGKDQAKLKAAEGASAEECKNTQTRLNPSGPPTAEIRCQSVTMDEFVSGLRRLATAFFQGLPVVNSTRIEGSWDIDLKYPARVMRITPSGIQSENGNSLFEAVEKQLGLKLELGKTPQQVLSVESAREQPTPDRAGDALPLLPPPQFEVAAIRVCDPKAPVIGSAGITIVTPRIEPGGRVTATCFPLLLLLRQAFNLGANQEIVGLPKSLQGDTIANRISITARAPAGTAPNDVTDAARTRDILNPLLKDLLVDRYKLTYHYEDRPADALTLVATKPKLTKADPSGRTGCSRSNQSGLTAVKLTCRNITMAQFAEQILGIYPAARYPVVDGTHLDGAWDFVVEFNPAGVLLQQFSAQQSAFDARGDATANNGVPEPAGPSGPTNLAEAIEKQIGLKLETHKRPAPVLVIDRMEDTPTNN